MIASNIVEGVDLNVADVSLDSILNEMVEATIKVYGSHIKIAAKFNDLMAFDWFDINHHEKSENNKILKTHKDPLYKAFKLAGHTNASVAYGRICEYGRNIRNGLSPNGKMTIDGQPVEQDAGESDGAAPAPRSAMLRNVEELTALWKFNDKQGKDLPAKVKAAQVKIAEALSILGLDVANIAK
jgi:hypothetical protein